MERLKNMKETLMNCVQNQMGGNLQGVDSKELGEAVDMIKDLSEAIYYCSITDAMEERQKEEKYSHYNERMYYPPVYYNDDRRRMYYDGRRGGDYYPTHIDDHSYPTEIRDYREGRSPITRRNYMESKELHHDKAKQMKELEKYMSELTQDILEMISDASPEEKMILSQKMTTLAEKIK